jgi:hypothetical protein
VHISGREIGELDIGERDIRERDIWATVFRERDIGETVTTRGFKQQLLVHIHIHFLIRGVSG